MKLKDRYQDQNVAEQYEQERQDNRIYRAEQKIVESVLSKIRPTRVLDIPVGTGRFLPFYDRIGATCVGVDVSAEMLEQAAGKQTKAQLIEQSIFDAIELDEGFDCVVTTRFLNWITEEQVIQAGKTLRGLVYPSGIWVFTLRTWDKGSEKAAGKLTYTHNQTVLDMLPIEVTERKLIHANDAGDYSLIVGKWI